VIALFKVSREVLGCSVVHEDSGIGDLSIGFMIISIILLIESDSHQSGVAVVEKYSTYME
jgi:hypothetical protein